MTEQDKDHGWAPDVGEGGSERAKAANEKAFGTPPAGSGEGREVSDEEREGVPPTDMEARTPHGVGESTSKRGEDFGKESSEAEGVKGPSQRPYGKTDEAD